MDRQWTGLTFGALLVSSLVLHVSGGGTSRAPGMRSLLPPATHADAKPEAASPVLVDAHTCYPFEVLSRQEGIARQPWASLTPEEAHAKNGGLVCSPPAPPKTVFEGQILIATVPNPLETSDSLEFDRAIAALQEAASAAGYDFERIATPWETSDLQEPKQLKEGREDEYYRRVFGDEPGAMLFYCKGWPDRCDAGATDHLKLLLLLVPESPVYGLNMHAAQEAMAAYDALMGVNRDPVGRTPMKWIGPEYSSSAGDLQRLRKDAGNLGKMPDFCALSGSISTDTAVALLKESNAPGAECLGDQQPSLAALDVDALTRLVSNSGFKDGPIALLAEDETVYGGVNFGNSSSDIAGVTYRRFSFPRGISHVRGLYGRSLRDASAQASQPDGAASAAAAIDFADALQQPFDTAEEFAAQSPISNESILASIAASVNGIGARTVVILATDPLDQIFLARYFHRSAPDSRLVLLNAEQLVPRLRRDFNLDGTIVVSRFPLFEASYLTLPEPLESRRSLSFASSSQEGVFLAALQQIRSDPIYQQPREKQQNALALWIGVSGAGEFWPVAREAVPNPPPAAPVNLPGSPMVHSPILLVDTPEEGLPTLWAFVLQTILLCSLIHLLLYVAAERGEQWPKRWPRLLRNRLLSYHFLYADRYPDGKPAAAGGKVFAFGQCWWLMNISILYLLAVTYLVLPAIVYRLAIAAPLHSGFCGGLWFLLRTSRWLGPLILVLVPWQAFRVVQLGWLSYKYRSSYRSNKERWTPVTAPVLSILWMAACLILFTRQLFMPNSGWLFAIRCLHLNSGVCPVLPLLLVCTGLFVIALAHLNALTLCSTRDPGFPAMASKYLSVIKWSKSLRKYMDDWSGVPPWPRRLIFSGLAVCTLVFNTWGALSTFDIASIGLLYLLMFLTCVYFALILATRFFQIWNILRFGLESLEASPLRHAFTRLPKEFSTGPIWSYAGLRRQVIPPWRSIEYLRVTPEIVRNQPNKEKIAADADEAVAELAARIRKGQQFDAADYRQFSQGLNSYAVRLAHLPQLLAFWARGGPDQHQGAHQDIPLSCQPGDDETVKLARANEFIASRFAFYIRYVTLHLKNLMTFMSGSLLFLVLGAVSYPFNHADSVLWQATGVLLLVLLIVASVLKQMARDPILNRLSDGKGELRVGAFALQLLSVGGLPALTVLATIFPALGNFVYSVARPIMQGLH